MAVSNATELKVRVKVDGERNLDRLSKQLGNIGKDTVSANFKFDKFTASLRQQQQESTRSISNLRAFAGAWRELANSVDYTSAQYREANREAQKLEKQLAKTQRRGGGGGKALSAIGAAGLLGPEQLVGAGIGAMFGAPLAGAAIASITVTPAKQIAAGMAESVADVNKYRIALAGVSKDQRDYADSVKAIGGFTREFLLPLGEATQQYTKLKASIVGAGMSTAETNKVFKGISAAIIATGGNAEDLNSALRATSQVFSKGKVSAEELRQQIGERLPGAFTIFAQSIGKTPQQLDKALEEGEVTLEQFLTFSEELFNRYGKTAEILASAPENAGQRLKVALNEASQTYGGFFQLVGAYLQDNQTKLINWLNDNSRIVKQYITDWVNAGYAIGQVLNQIIGGFARFTKRLYDLMQANPGVWLANQLGGFVRDRLGIGKGKGKFKPEDLFPDFKPSSFGTGLGDLSIPTSIPGEADDEGKSKRKLKEARDLSAEMLDLYVQLAEAQRDNNKLRQIEISYSLREQQINEDLLAKRITVNFAVKQGLESEQRLRQDLLRLRKEEKKEMSELPEKQEKVNKKLTENQQLAKSIVETFASGMADAFMNMFEQAKSLKDILSDVLKQTARLFLEFGLRAGMKGLFPSLFATGGIMTSNGPVALKRYARGGVANSPQLAMFGEGSTPEAYVPLPDGRSIPVKMKGGGEGNKVVVNVDASGTQVQGNQPDAAALGRAIGAAVQAELVKQKRPGGLLA